LSAERKGAERPLIVGLGAADMAGEEGFYRFSAVGVQLIVVWRKRIFEVDRKISKERGQESR
jgi:hypothetical protein